MEGELELNWYAIYQAVPFPMTLTLFSRSHHSLTLNISQTATDTATEMAKDMVIVTMEGE